MAITKSTEPRYRYYEEAPERISVPVSELLEKIPSEFHRGGDIGDLSGRLLDLACRDLFLGNTPRLPLGTLHDLLPDLMQLPEGSDRAHLLSLPAGWLALHFSVVTRREELPPEPEPMPATKEESLTTRENKEEQSGNSKAGAATRPDSKASKGSLEASITLALPELKPSAEASSGAVVEGAIVTSLISDKTAKTGQKEAPAVVDATQKVMEKKRGFFASLPIFRRHQPLREAFPIASEREPARPSFMIPMQSEGKTASPSKLKELPKESSKESVVGPTEPLPKATEQHGQPESIPTPETKETSLTLERLWKLDPQDLIADPAPLQSLFMTEERLSLDRVMAMAGQLPGLRACVLAHGDHVVCASSTPVGMDLRNLSVQAMTMLTQIKESSEKMGLGAVPAITLHADQGVLSFLHQGELCLLVLHSDRGFVPGVRERLQEMLGYLSAARALPEGDAFQPTLPI